MDSSSLLLRARPIGCVTPGGASGALSGRIVRAVGWFGVLVPSATPRAIVEKLSADINRTLARDDIAGPLRESGIEPVGTSPDQYAQILRTDTAKWRRMIQEAGIKAD